MRLFSSKSYTFQDGEEEASIKNQEIKDMPEWIENTLLFELAKKEGSISVIENTEQLKAAENGKKINNKSKGKNEKNAEVSPENKEKLEDKSNQPPENK